MRRRIEPQFLKRANEINTIILTHIVAALYTYGIASIGNDAEMT